MKRPSSSRTSSNEVQSGEEEDLVFKTLGAEEEEDEEDDEGNSPMPPLCHSNFEFR